MNIFDTLKEEHDMFRKTFTKLFSEKPRGKAFEDFNRDWDMHMEGEEQILYPRTKEAGLQNMTLESIEEHHAAKLMLHELESMSGTEETWTPKLRILIEHVEHHLQEEEKKLYPLARLKIKGQIQEEMNHLYWDFKVAADMFKLSVR